MNEPQKTLYVIVGTQAEPDHKDALIYETNVRDATLEDALSRMKFLEKKFGKGAAKVAKLVLLSDDEILNESSEMALIFGVAKAADFREFRAIKDLESRCEHIWNNAHRFADVTQYGEDAWFNFLKYLWVRLPDGEEKRITEFVPSLQK